MRFVRVCKHRLDVISAISLARLSSPDCGLHLEQERSFRGCINGRPARLYCDDGRTGIRACVRTKILRVVLQYLNRVCFMLNVAGNLFRGCHDLHMPQITEIGVYGLCDDYGRVTRSLSNGPIRSSDTKIGNWL